MKSRTGFKKILVLFLTAMLFHAATADNNVNQVVIMNEGESQLNAILNKQTKNKAENVAILGNISYSFNKIKKWEGKYNFYLKEISGFANAIVAGTSIYADAMQTIRLLYDLENAIGSNPQGVAASLVMSDIYTETALELVDVFVTIKDVNRGGKLNMMTGAERTQLLWNISDKLSRLNRKLRELVISIAYHNLTDVWNKYTAGLIQRDHASIARDALSRWRRVSKVAHVLNS